MSPDTKEHKDDLAVSVRNAVKSYERNGPSVLDNLNMSVPRGAIYVLLGASGAGKTTLLTAVVGLLKLDSGQIKVLGGIPGEKNSGVPGPRVGFMPQEVALVEEFSVRDSFNYFGLLFGVDRSEIKERFDFLSHLLQLPPGQNLIKSLSGGQARRVSLGVSLVQNPELLILDEPTVGQDPILREGIWKYLVQLSEIQCTTIIITTHYIEEAKAAHRVGLLRHGILLAETSPRNLLIRYNCDSLDEVALLLSQRQTERISSTTTATTQERNKFEVMSDPTVIDTEECPDPSEFIARPPPPETRALRKSSTFNRMSALLFKNFMKLIRNYPGLCFVLGFPVFYLLCFFLGIGRDSLNVPVALINDELGNCYDLPGGIQNHTAVHVVPAVDQHHTDECHFRGISCVYIDMLHGKNKITSYFYTSVDEALEELRSGKFYSAIHIQKNFSVSLQRRFYDPYSLDDDIVNMSDIKIWMDMSDFYTSTSLKKHYLDVYKDLASYLSRRCNYTADYGAIPVRINDPIYGSNQVNYTLSMLPALILAIMMFLTTVYTASTILLEKIEGVWCRNIVAGVSSAEILTSHMLSHSFVIIIQNVEMFLLCFYVFDLYLLGSVWTMLAIVFLQSLMGSVFGLMISCLVDDVSTAYITSMGTFLPFIATSGFLWPMEGMPRVMQIICLILPGLYPSRTLHNILFKGWSITHPDVFYGFLVTLGWILIFGGISIFKLRRAKH